MNISLIAPPAGGLDSKPDRAGGIYPPLGLLYIATALENIGHKVDVIDIDCEELSKRQLINRLMRHDPAVVGLTVVSHMFPSVLQVAKVVKKTLPNTVLITGGPHVGIYPTETLYHPEIDMCVRGEGEITIVELIKAIEQNKPLEEVSGISFKKSSKIYHTPPRKFIRNLDDIPFPARHLVPVHRYFSIVCKKLPFTTMISSRGCPYDCSFCSSKAQWERIFRARSAKNVVDEMEDCIIRYNVNEIFFYDDTFTVNKKRVLQICDEIKRRRIDVFWDVRTRIDCVDREMLRKMKEAGCIRIHYGIESGDEHILNNVLKKGIALDQARKVVKWTRENKIDIFTYWMLGAPTETRETIKKTIDFALELDSDYVMFSIVHPEPQTELYEIAKKMKIFEGDYWADVTLEKGSLPPPVFETEELSEESLIEFSKKAYSSFYLRPRYIFRRFSKLHSLSEARALSKGFIDLLSFRIAKTRRHSPLQRFGAKQEGKLRRKSA